MKLIKIKRWNNIYIYIYIVLNKFDFQVSQKKSNLFRIEKSKDIIHTAYVLAFLTINI